MSLSAPMKCRSLHYDEFGHLRTWHINNAGKTLYRDRNHVVKVILQLENKQQSMPNNVETQHKHMYSYIGSLCNIVFPAYLHHYFTGICENWNALEHGIELCLL